MRREDGFIYDLLFTIYLVILEFRYLKMVVIYDFRIYDVRFI